MLLAWFAVVFGINSTRKAVNCTRLRLVQLLPVLLVLLIKIPQQTKLLHILTMYKKSTVQLARVGLAQARPNNQVASADESTTS